MNKNWNERLIFIGYQIFWLGCNPSALVNTDWGHQGSVLGAVFWSYASFFPSLIGPLLIIKQDIQSQVRMFLAGEISYSWCFLSTLSPWKSHLQVTGRYHGSVLLTRTFRILPLQETCLLHIPLQSKGNGVVGWSKNSECTTGQWILNQWHDKHFCYQY